jgi:hypothetical protein
MDAAERWLRANDPEYSKRTESDRDAYTGERYTPEDLYGIAPTQGESAEAAAELFAHGDENRYVLKRRSRPKGRQRVTRPALLRRGGPLNGLYTTIHNDHAAIAEYLERDRPLDEWRAAVARRRPPMRFATLRHQLGRRIRELYAQGAHQIAIARVLGCGVASIRRLAGSPRSTPRIGRRDKSSDLGEE